MCFGGGGSNPQPPMVQPYVPPKPAKKAQAQKSPFRAGDTTQRDRALAALEQDQSTLLSDEEVIAETPTGKKKLLGA